MHTERVGGEARHCVHDYFAKFVYEWRYFGAGICSYIFYNFCNLTQGSHPGGGRRGPFQETPPLRQSHGWAEGPSRCPSQPVPCTDCRFVFGKFKIEQNLMTLQNMHNVNAFHLACGGTCCAPVRLWTCLFAALHTSLSCLYLAMQTTHIWLGVHCVCVGYINTQWRTTYATRCILRLLIVHQFSCSQMNQSISIFLNYYLMPTRIWIPYHELDMKHTTETVFGLFEPTYAAHNKELSVGIHRHITHLIQSILGSNRKRTGHYHSQPWSL